jgi:hypothetical protein
MKKMLDAVFEALVKTGVDFQSHYHRLMKNISAASQPEPCSSSRATSLDPTTWAATLSRVQDAAQLTRLPQKLLEGGESSFLAEKKVSSPSSTTSRKDLSEDRTATGSIFDIEVNRELQRNFFYFYLHRVCKR